MNTQNELNRKLVEAAEKGETAEVKAFLDAGADVNAKLLLGRTLTGAKSPYGVTALILAVRKGHTDIARMLIAAGADVNKAEIDKDDEIPIECSALYWGMTPLMWAARFGHADMARALLDAGADVDARTRCGKTALIIATGWAMRNSGQTETVQTLLAAGADVNAADDYGRTALMGPLQPETAQALLAAGADVNAKDKDGRTALMWPLRPETARALLAAGADVNAKDKDGSTALMSVHRPETARALLVAGADVNAKTKFEETALMKAAENGQAETALVLLAAGADVNAADKRGWTALRRAVQPFHATRPERRRGYADTARALLENGADAAKLVAALRGEGTEHAAKALARLFAAGAFAPDAEAVAQRCGEALRGLAGGDMTTIGEDEIRQVTAAVGEELDGQLGDWRKDMDDDAYLADPVACIESGATGLEAPIELERFAAHFAANEDDAARARARAEELLTSRLAAELAALRSGLDKETVRDRARYVLEQNLRGAFKTFGDLVAHLGKTERRPRLNI